MEEAEQGRCSLCPTTQREIDRAPEAPNLEIATKSTLHCGHQVHTHCMIHELYMERTTAACPECNLTIIPQANIDFYRLHLYQDYDHDDRERVRIINLWNTDESFRNDIKAYKKLLGKLNTVSLPYKRDVKVITNRFKQNTLASVALIKDQQRLAKADYKVLPSLKLYRKHLNVSERSFRDIKNKWGTSRWNLRYLNDIEGAPKFYRNVHYRWRGSNYLFRVRI
jgi:hypothetical protein